MRILRADGDRRLSACVFGHQHKLDLLAAFANAPDGRVNLGALARERGVAASVYYPPIQDLILIRLVAPVARTAGDRRQWYERTGSRRVWEAVAVLVDSLQGLGVEGP